MEIFHNPKCSKSRDTLQLLKDRDIDPEIRLYLDQPPSLAELKKIAAMLNIAPRDLIRRGEDVYRELVAAHGEPSDQQALQWMTQYPKLIERPIVINEGRACIGRPPENVLNIL